MTAGAPRRGWCGSRRARSCGDARRTSMPRIADEEMPGADVVDGWILHRLLSVSERGRRDPDVERVARRGRAALRSEGKAPLHASSNGSARAKAPTTRRTNTATPTAQDDVRDGRVARASRAKRPTGDRMRSARASFGVREMHGGAVGVDVERVGPRHEERPRRSSRRQRASPASSSGAARTRSARAVDEIAHDGLSLLQR